MGRLEFSKWLLVGSYGMMIIITTFAATMFYMGYHIDGFIPIVLASWAEVTTVNAFYMNKAKAENKIKIAKSLPKEALENIELVRDLFH